MLFENMAGNEDICEKSVVKELRFEEKNNLFTIFPIGATMQDGGKRKEVTGLIMALEALVQSEFE